MSDWAEKLVRSLLERIESDPNPDVRLDALEALGHTAQPGVPEVSSPLDGSSVITPPPDSLLHFVLKPFWIFF